MASKKTEKEFQDLCDRMNDQTQKLQDALPYGRDLWLITIGGYGSFFFAGTEEEAEGMRSHKASWEGGIGKKYILKPNVLDRLLRSTKVGDLSEEE